MAVVIPKQMQVEVFVNQEGDIAIHQHDERESQLVAFSPDHANMVIVGIKAAVKEARGQ